MTDCSSGSDQRDALVAKIEAAGSKAIRADVCDSARSVEVDVLVNNASVMALTPIAEAGDDALDETITVNRKGGFNGMREAAKRRREGGRIISVSSSMVGLCQPTYALYAATGAGIEASRFGPIRQTGSGKALLVD